MKLKCFTVFDSGVKSYLQPFFMRHSGEAIRAVTELVNDDKHSFAKYANDYTLFEIGVFDDSDCKFALHNTPISLGVLIEFKRPKNGVIEVATSVD